MPPPVAITIGNFDGVHLGHAALIRAARAAGGDDTSVTALAFDPHPVAVLRPEAAPPRLSRFDQRCEWLREAGADEVVRLEPTPDLLGQGADEFLDAVVRRHRPAFIVEGDDFRFGRGRAGSIDTIRGAESRLGYKTIVVDAVEAPLSDHSIVRASSSMIRWLLGCGRVRDAAILLGRPYELRSRVVVGDQRGRTIGVPTANLEHPEQLLPADGIYAGAAVRPDGERFPAAISVGTKPTFGEHPRVCEAHLIGYGGPLDDYGWTLRLEFHDWLRDQLFYSSVEALVDQLHRDIARALERSRSHDARMNEGAAARRHAGTAGAPSNRPGARASMPRRETCPSST